MKFLVTLAAAAAYTSLASATWLQSNGSHFVDPYSEETIKHFSCGTRFRHGSDDFNQTLHKLAKAQKEHSKKGGTRRPGALNVRQTVPTPIAIPLYFHVLQSTAKAGTITDAMAQNQVDALNKAYNPYGISFNYQGVDYTTNDAWAIAAGADMDAAKTALRKGTYSALNIYFHTDFAGGNLGTCSLPSQVPAGADPSLYASDGCNVNANTMPGGSMLGYNMGGTAIHETGHWLGLLHTFEGYSCDGPGDYIDDTPAQSVATNGCPEKPAKDSCPSQTGVDPIHNYMDYSTDVCYQGFTPLQIQRIGNMWNQYRLNIGSRAAPRTSTTAASPHSSTPFYSSLLSLLERSSDVRCGEQPVPLLSTARNDTIFSRKSANIPLRTITSSSRRHRRPSDSGSDGYDEKRSGSRERLRLSGSDDGTHSDEEGSEFSLWSDTGDLVDQLAEEEDPLSVRLRNLEEDGRGHRRGRGEKKRVRYASANGHGDEEKQRSQHRQQPGVPRRLEDIPIPEPPPQRLNWGQKALALVMAPNDGPSRMHGLHGQKLIYFLSVFVSLGVFLFGYDQGVMSGIITGPFFRDYFNQPSSAEIGTMVAILEIGAFIASLSIGRVGDLLGRRKTIFYGAVVFVVGGACQTFATGMPMMMVGRLIAGFGVGALSTIVPVYQSEISPPHNRGKLACIEFSGNIFGYMCSVWVDYFCSYIKDDWSWRLPLLMQVAMGGLLAVGSFLIVESPRWLLDNDHDEEGIVVIANLYGKGDIHNQKARDEYREIKMNVLLQRQEGERSYKDMFKRYYKRVFIAMSAQSLAQLNGINVISYYAPLVFEQAGWVGRAAILMTGINAITYLASTIPPWYIVDKWGRRFILLSGAVSMVISLSAISYFIYIDISSTPTLVVIFVMIYNAAFGYSWGPIPWLYPPEILPLSIRAKGASLSTAANWAFNFLVGEMTPILQDAIKWRLYLLHAFFCAVSFVVVWFIYPETANVRLEDMNSLFGDATTAAPTPATLAQAESLFSGNRSPVSSFRLGDDGEQVPDIDLAPPDLDDEDQKPLMSKDSEREGVGGWISSIAKRGKSEGQNGSGSGKYQRVGQDEQGRED